MFELVKKLTDLFENAPEVQLRFVFAGNFFIELFVLCDCEQFIEDIDRLRSKYIDFALRIVQLVLKLLLIVLHPLKGLL